MVYGNYRLYPNVTEHLYNRNTIYLIFFTFREDIDGANGELTAREEVTYCKNLCLVCNLDNVEFEMHFISDLVYCICSCGFTMVIVFAQARRRCAEIEMSWLYQQKIENCFVCTLSSPFVMVEYLCQQFCVLGFVVFKLQIFITSDWQCFMNYNLKKTM